MSDIKQKIRTYIVENYLFGDDEGLEDNTSFLDEGIVDSTGILELIGYITDEFDIHVEDDELVPENLDSLHNVSAYIARKSEESERAAAV